MKRNKHLYFVLYSVFIYDESNVRLSRLFFIVLQKIRDNSVVLATIKMAFQFKFAVRGYFEHQICINIGFID
jgi:hypothetical protein